MIIAGPVCVGRKFANSELSLVGIRSIPPNDFHLSGTCYAIQRNCEYNVCYIPRNGLG